MLFYEKIIVLNNLIIIKYELISLVSNIWWLIKAILCTKWVELSGVYKKNYDCIVMLYNVIHYKSSFSDKIKKKKSYCIMYWFKDMNNDHDQFW